MDFFDGPGQQARAVVVSARRPLPPSHDPPPATAVSDLNAPPTRPRWLARCQDPKVHADALRAGHSPFLAALLAGRLRDRDGGLEGLAGRLADIPPPDLLPDVAPACARLARALARSEHIVLATDHDVDGVTSHAVLWSALAGHFGHPPERLHTVISHRIREGYGLSSALSARIRALPVAVGLVVTADQGSCDGDRIAELAADGIDTVVTDHHQVAGAGPAAAVACVNPQRQDSRYPDRAIAGCMVAWLLMCALRNHLVAEGRLPAAAPRLGGLLDFVALGTVADAVSLGSSAANRAVVRAGLARMNQMARPAWQAFARVRPAPWRATDLAFGLGPLINAGSRVADVMPGVRALVAATPAEASAEVDRLVAANEARRALERSLTSQALAAWQAGHQPGEGAVCVAFEQGSAGVHGIVASRLVEHTGCPALCLSPRVGHPGLLSGSLRTVADQWGGALVDIHAVLAEIDSRHPGLLLTWGGHAAAGGLSIEAARLPELREAWQSAVLARRPPQPPRRWFDPAPAEPLCGAHLEELDALQPFGRGFEAPVLALDCRITGSRPLGDGSHRRLSLAGAGEAGEAVWFRAAVDRLPDLPADGRLYVSLHPPTRWTRGSLDLQVHDIG